MGGDREKRSNIGTTPFIFKLNSLKRFKFGDMSNYWGGGGDGSPLVHYLNPTGKNAIMIQYEKVANFMS